MTTADASLGFLQRRLAPWFALAESEPALTEILYDGGGHVAVDVGGELYAGAPAIGCVLSDEDVIALGANAAVWSDQVWSRERPFLSVMLPDGWRVTFVRAPAVQRPVMTLRRLIRAAVPLERYVADGMMSDRQAEELRQIVLAKENVIVSGAVGVGKTTLARTLLELVPSDERIVTIEDPAELQLLAADGSPRRHWVALEATPTMDMAALLRASLRLRPDRIIVGEVRGPDALEMVRAANVGHRGMLGTIHSHGAGEAIARLHTLTVEAQPGFLLASVERAIDIVVQLEGRGAKRRIGEIWRRHQR